MLSAARRDPSTLFIGVDASLAGLIEASRAAARRPERGGAPNALFVRAPIERLPAELAGSARAVTVLLPWGSLLRAVALPEVHLLTGIRGLCATGAIFETVFSVAEADAAEAARLGLPAMTLERFRCDLPAAYRAAGLRITAIEELPAHDLAAIPTTWARRLAHGRPRPAFRLRATAARSSATAPLPYD